VALGFITAYFVYVLIRDAKKNSEANWKPVVVAKMDIAPKKRITRDMIDLTRMAEKHLALGAVTDLSLVEGKMSLERIRAKDQIRDSVLVKEGQGPGLSYEIPPGKRAITIKVDEVIGVGGTVLPKDRVDILATFTDTVAKQEVTQILLQNVLVLAVDMGGRTEPGKDAKGATTSLTLAVSPEETELLTAADRTGALRVVSRPPEDEVLIASQGVRSTEIGRGRFELAPNTFAADTNQTPITIISPRSDRQPRQPLTIFRAEKETEVPRQ
jgi:pilus assembly protein CpaB